MKKNLKSVNIWQSYKQERRYLVPFLRLLTVHWPGAQSAWDSHMLACDVANDKFSLSVSPVISPCVCVCGAGVGWSIQCHGRLLEVCSAWLWPYCLPRTSANHLHRRCLSADDRRLLYAQESPVQRETETKISRRHQLHACCTGRRCAAKCISVASETAAVTSPFPLVTVFLFHADFQ